MFRTFAYPVAERPVFTRLVGRGARRRRQILERDPLAAPRDVVPVAPLRVVEGEQGLLSLTRIERAQEGHCRPCQRIASGLIHLRQRGKPERVRRHCGEDAVQQTLRRMVTPTLTRTSRCSRTHG